MKRKSPPSNEFDGYHSVNPLKRVEIGPPRYSPLKTGLNIPSRAFQRLANAKKQRRTMKMKKSSPSNKFDG